MFRDSELEFDVHANDIQCNCGIYACSFGSTNG